MFCYQRSWSKTRTGSELTCRDPTHLCRGGERGREGREGREGGGRERREVEGRGGENDGATTFSKKPNTKRVAAETIHIASCKTYLLPLG